MWRQIIAEDTSNRSIGSAGFTGGTCAVGLAACGRLQRHAEAAALRGSHDSRVFAAWAETFSARWCGARVCFLPAVECRVGGACAGGRAAAGVPRTRGLRRCVAVATEIAAMRSESAGRWSASAAWNAGGCNRYRRRPRCAEQSVRNSCSRCVGSADFWRRIERHRAEPCVVAAVPKSAEERAEIEGVFREMLAPELQSIDADLSSTPWEFSGGRCVVVYRDDCGCAGNASVDAGTVAAARE